MSESLPKIEDSAFLKYEKTETDAAYLKKVDAFSSQEINNPEEKDGFLDSGDAEKLKNEFSDFDSKFGNDYKLKDNENYKKIKEKVDQTVSNILGFNEDFLELGKMISDLKKDLLGKSVGQEKKAAETQPEDKILKQALESDFVNNLNLDKKISKSFIGSILKSWLGEGKLKELIKIPVLGDFLKGIVGLDKGDKFSNAAEKLLKGNEILKDDKKTFEVLLGESPLKNGVNIIKKFLDGIKNNKDGKKIISDTFDELSKYDSGIKSYSSKEIKVSENGTLVDLQIETSGARESVFLRRELNGTETEDLSNSLDISGVINKHLKSTGDKKQAVENAINEIKQNFNLGDFEKLIKTKENIRIVEIDNNDHSKLNISFISTKSLFEKVKEKTE